MTRVSTLHERTSSAADAVAQSYRVVDRLIRAAAVLLFVLLGLLAVFSLTWKFQHDSAVMMYIAFLIERLDFAPYRDLFDINLPGSYLAYAAIGRLGGYSDLGGRVAGLIVLAAILVVNWGWLRQVSPRAAWLGSALWGVLYLGLGPNMSLQREQLMLLPLLGSVALASNRSLARLSRNLMAGLCLGMAATIKPQVLVGLPMLVLAGAWSDEGRETDGATWSTQVIRTLSIALVGVSIPLILVVIYLWAIGALGALLDMAVKYWPLYTSLDGGHRKQVGWARLANTAMSYRDFGGLGVWLAPAAMGAFVALYQSTLGTWQKRQVWILTGLVASYSIYAALAGQFWRYHWLPFYFFAVQLATLCVVERPRSEPVARLAFPSVVLAATIMTVFPVNLTVEALRWRKLPTPLPERRAVEISRFLDARLREGDTVQPLDWTGGAAHALLISKARLATSFVYDFHFYHDVSTPYIQALRRRFIGELKQSRPRFIVEVTDEQKPWVKGDDTTREFEELRQFLGMSYRVASEGEGYRVHEIAAAPEGPTR